MQAFFMALALVFVIEGILPFLSPPFWRRVVLSISKESDRTLRITGLVSMICGVIFLYVVHHG
jgi:uncharacterized protein YjeT (DUF2065 family)